MTRESEQPGCVLPSGTDSRLGSLNLASRLAWSTPVSAKRYLNDRQRLQCPSPPLPGDRPVAAVRERRQIPRDTEVKSWKNKGKEGVKRADAPQPEARVDGAGS